MRSMAVFDEPQHEINPNLHCCVIPHTAMLSRTLHPTPIIGLATFKRNLRSYHLSNHQRPTKHTLQKHRFLQLHTKLDHIHILRRHIKHYRKLQNWYVTASEETPSSRNNMATPQIPQEIISFLRFVKSYIQTDKQPLLNTRHLLYLINFISV